MKLKIAAGPFPVNWITLGIFVLVSALAMRAVAPAFAYEAPFSEMPILGFVFAYMFSASVVAFSLLAMIEKTDRPNIGYLFLFILIVGTLARLLQFGTSTIIEDDYYRYLWDGAVVSIWHSPFSHAPLDVLNGTAGSTELQDLAKRGEDILSRVNHPEIRTIYPSVLQAIFAFSHLLAPFDLDGWRAVLLLFEFGIAGLILALLLHFQRSPLWLALYWWNPLVIKEVANSAHMEPVLMLPVLLAVYAIVRLRPIWASVWFVIAAGVKVWPFLIGALVWRNCFYDRPLFLKCIAVACVITGVLFLPVVLSSLDQSSGFVAFAQNWKASSAAILVAEWITGFFTTDPEIASGAARLLLGVALLATFVAICARPAVNENILIRRVFLMIAALYLLAPSQTPWYFIWIAPFLCLFPVRGLILAGVTLPLHYLFFFFVLHDQEQVYRQGVVWLIWIPVWALLAHDVLIERLRSTGPKDEPA
ncbi:MAG: hypothetical protein AAFQ38_07990 [Pseudomonadota bacterium]